MEQFVEFINNHILFSLGFMVLVAVVIAYEVKEKLLGIPKLGPNEVVHLMNHKDALALDLRDTAAFNKGHVLGSACYSQEELEAKLSKLDSKTPVVIVTQTGIMPTKVLGALKAAKISECFVLKGGIEAWRNAQLPLVTGK